LAALDRDGNTHCASLTTAERAVVLQKLASTAGLGGTLRQRDGRHAASVHHQSHGGERQGE
jgi:hypothetical protein